MPEQIVTFNYLISLITAIFGLLLWKRGSEFKNAALHMFCFCGASLFGGFFHHLHLNEAFSKQFLSQINQILPVFVEPLDYWSILGRIWHVTFILIGFTEYFFMYIFMHPVIQILKLRFVGAYLKGMLLCFFLLSLFSTQYLWVVLFHSFSHLLMSLFALYLLWKFRLPSMKYLLGLCAFNLTAGVLQQLLKNKIISSGSLHYNDWYHLLIILFACFLHYSLTKGGIVKELQNKSLFFKQQSL